VNLGKLHALRILNLRKNTILAILCLFAYLPAQAEIVIRAGRTPFNQYAAWIATHPADRSWVAELEKRHPSHLRSSKLLDLVEGAQKAFLSGSLDDAKNKFIAIASMAHNDDWHKPQREAITYAMLRTAQLHIGRIHSQYLIAAAQFGFDIHFGVEVFPPPLVKEWKNEISLAKSHATKISSLKDFVGFDILKIDGRSYPIKNLENIEMMPGEHRVSLLANHANYFTQKINSSQLQVMKIKPDILVYGNCNHPKAPLDAKFAFTAIFEKACVRHFDGINWAADADTKLERLDLQAENFKNSPIQALNSQAKSSNEHPRRWLWIGIGAVVLTSVAMVYKNNQNKFGANSDPETSPTITPSHHEN
jgi:hypothetical protein